MRDQRGLYFYPFPRNHRVRMYVRKQGDDICFRLWNADDPVMWMEHGWVPHDAIRMASRMYDKKGFDPNRAYDIDAARALLAEEGH